MTTVWGEGIAVQSVLYYPFAAKVTRCPPVALLCLSVCRGRTQGLPGRVETRDRWQAKAKRRRSEGPWTITGVV